MRPCSYQHVNVKQKNIVYPTHPTKESTLPKHVDRPLSINDECPTAPSSSAA